MKRFLVLLLVSGMLCAVTSLGGMYVVARDKSPYAAEEGDHAITTLAKGTKVRLIKDETVAEALLLAPLRITKLLVNIEPRGNWLVEDEKGNRGYMWDSDLSLVKPRR